jgi:uncharacterized membrane protein
MIFAISFHLLAATVWVGGMFFAYVVLRPIAADIFQPPQRLLLWQRLFSQFFLWVWLAIIALLISGHTMISLLGGMAAVAMHVHIMMMLGYLMMFIFMHLYFAPFKRLKTAVSAENWPEAGNQLNTIRKIIAVNLGLGLVTIVVASAGRYI